MIKIFRNFFNFCGKQNKKKMVASMWLGVLKSVFEALRIPAVYIMLTALLSNSVTYTVVFECLGVMILSITGSAIIQSRITMLQCQAGYGTCADKRMEIAEHLRYVPMGYFNKNSLGTITSITTNTLELLASMATRVVMISTQGYLSTAVVTLMVLLWNWKIGLILLCGIVFFIIVNSYMQKKASLLANRKYTSDSNLVSKAIEYILGIAEVKAYNMTGSSRKELNDANNENKDVNIKLELTFVPLMCLQGMIIKLTGVAMILASLGFYFAGTMKLVDSLCMIICSFIIYSHLDSAGSFSALLKNVNLCMERVNEVLKTPTMDLEGKQGQGEDSTISDDRSIFIKDISFSYENKKIIDDISLKIPLGTSTAFVGSSGSGKTTLCHLISRFWDVDEGAIYLKGKNIKDYKYDDLMKNFSFVFQNVYLFKDTVANNIAFGQNDAPREKIIEAAKKACCHEFIMNLPQGYDTVIGEGGASLSGGEKQRISIARAIMKDSPIIILDEATANVDPENEADLIHAIEELTKSKTIIMIAHRLKTVRNADNIVVIDSGKIAEMGKHDNLMKKGGIYARFVESRQKAAGWKI
ncbi:ABC transporter ATP-binding protein [Treponema parvum]|uniref:ABC transporter ATP-binding protein n=1 Tax=Treponema parvum TaxID=138851 RepID=A0A975F102_9SPIR|nr:ABC transporter ATP-binding protein [Treponema parvum]QTQ12596.1 ABC transporter ATP-binding protein [Treponema parvum]